MPSRTSFRPDIAQRRAHRRTRLEASVKALLIIIAMPMAAYATAYKCEIDGEVIYSQSPCQEAAQELNIAPRFQSGGDVSEDGLRPGERAWIEQIRRKEQSEQSERITRERDARMQRKKEQSGSRDNAYWCDEHKTRLKEYQNKRRSGCTVKLCDEYDAAISESQRDIKRYCK